MKSIQTIVDLEAKTRLLQEAEEKRKAQIDEIVGHIRSAFDSLIDGTETVEEAFRKMMYNIARSIWEQQVMDPLADAATSWITKTFFSAKGSAWNNGVQMFANGGVVNSPTPFRYAGGVGIMGEAGAEAIMPLKRGPDGKLGVAGGGNVTIHQNFNFAANGDESVKRIIAQEAPKIANMTQSQFMDARRRGGAMRNTFG
jgi:phage-related minor tail protein